MLLALLALTACGGTRESAPVARGTPGATVTLREVDAVTSVISAAQLATGELVLLDSDDRSVFIAKDDSVRRIPLRAGRGPGDVGAMRRVFSRQDGGLAGWDQLNNALVSFDHVGRVLASRSLTEWTKVGQVEVVGTLANERLIAIRTMTAINAESRVRRDSFDILLGTADARPAVVHSLPGDSWRLVGTEGRQRAIRLPRLAPRSISVCEDRIVLLHGDSLFVLDTAGQIVTRRRRFWPAFPLDVSAEARRAVREQADDRNTADAVSRWVERQLAAHDSIVPEPTLDSRARLWISVHTPNSGSNRRIRRYAQFDLEGQQLQYIDAPPVPMLIIEALRDRLLVVQPTVGDSDPRFGTLQFADVGADMTSPRFCTYARF